MARELRKFSVTVPAGTPKASPATFNLAFPPRIVRQLEIRIPPGPRGNVGFQLAQAGAQVFPTEPGAFFVSDDERLIWPIEGANTSGAWQVIAYNTGTFDHELEFRFLVDLPGALAALSPGGEPLEVIPSSPGLPESLPPAELPLGQLPELPAPLPLPPPGVPVAPGPVNVPGPQAPPLPTLPPAPALPALPNLALAGSVSAALEQAEAIGHANLEAAAAAANQAALLDELEAIGQAAHERSLGLLPAPPSPPGSTKILI